MRHRGDRLSSRLIRGPGRTSKLKTMIVAIAALDSMALKTCPIRESGCCPRVRIEAQGVDELGATAS